MGTKFRINKNILIVIISFCISAICFRINDLQYLIKYHTFDFYSSRPIENIVYEVGTSSVYTVVGDNASKKILEYKDESTEIINGYKNANIFVINNDSKKTYSNNEISDLNEFNKITKDYPYILEINFKENTLKRIEGRNKYNFKLKDFSDVAKLRKEDVTTYIAIPDLDKIRKDKYEDSLYFAYKQFVGYNREFVSIVGSKIIASIVLLIIVIRYVIYLRKLKNNGIESLDYIESNNVSGNTRYMLIYNKLKDSKGFSIESFTLLGILLSIFSYKSIHTVLYIPITTLLILDLYYLLILILNSKNIESLINNSILVGMLYTKNKSKDEIVTIKFVPIILFCTVIQIIIIFNINYFLNKDYYGNIVYYIEHLIEYPINLLHIFIIILSNILLSFIIKNKMIAIIDIQNCINKFKSGDFSYKIEISEKDIFKDIANDINSLGEVINTSVEERLKSEKMKTELITNVSHDLKTPLTAIINYVSLLKKEDIKPEHVKDYVKILDNRTQKLKILIDDLFEASKISSQDLEITLEKTDINQLLTQSIVEMESEIETTQLNFILNTPGEEVYIMADGRKLWRVFENLISNILKYSLEGTRVYIDINKNNKKVNIIMKNISNYPLNIDPNEITERFTRGDLSRNTEGSGLGLSIAKGFVELQDGSLDIEIIGDLFIVKLEFEIYEE